MKKCLSFLVLLLYCITTQAQKIAPHAIPKTVIEAFKKSHPTAVNLFWTKHDTNYEVKFTVNKNIKNLMYNSKGTLVFNEAKVALTKIPVAIKKYLETHHSNQSILKVTKMTTMTNVFSYAVEINDRNLTFDSKGNFIKTEMK
jgi:methylthioribose-1-phosphate isomerase